MALARVYIHSYREKKNYQIKVVFFDKKCVAKYLNGKSYEKIKKTQNSISNN
jgi:hypothetical protein